jgi:hypothetical protein
MKHSVNHPWNSYLFDRQHLGPNSFPGLLALCDVDYQKMCVNETKQNASALMKLSRYLLADEKELSICNVSLVPHLVFFVCFTISG